MENFVQMTAIQGAVYISNVWAVLQCQFCFVQHNWLFSDDEAVFYL